MTPEHLIAFNLVLLAALVSPGPAFLVSVQTALVAGRGAGIVVGFGLGSMAALWTLMALLGLDVVFSAFPWAYAAAKIAGGLYLAYVALRMWLEARKPVGAQAAPATRRLFLRGFLVNMLNPKSMLFAAAVLIVVFPRGMTLANDAVVVLNHFAVELAFYSSLAWFMTTRAVRERYLRARVVLDRGAAVVLGGLAGRLLVDR